MLAYTDRPYTGRGTRKQQITYFQCHEAADIRYDIIYPEQHIRGIAVLYLLVIYCQTKIKVLHIASRLLQRNKRANSCGIVKTLA